MIGKVYLYSPPIHTCIIKANDYGKKCNDDNNCEGECKIINEDFLKEKWELLHGKTYDENGTLYPFIARTAEVNLSEFEDKTGLKIKGSRSQFKKNSYCGGDNKEFNVNNGKINILWQSNYEDCNKILDGTKEYNQF